MSRKETKQLLSSSESATKKVVSNGKCARCGRPFTDPLFITCQACRSPVKDDGGGCHHWLGINECKRITDS